jgi:hypothetical protein
MKNKQKIVLFHYFEVKMKIINEIQFKATARGLFVDCLNRVFSHKGPNPKFSREEAKKFLEYACDKSKAKYPCIARAKDPREYDDVFLEKREEFDIDYFVDNTIQIWCGDHIEILPGSRCA